jgi:hypothetical protein
VGFANLPCARAAAVLSLLTCCTAARLINVQHTSTLMPS